MQPRYIRVDGLDYRAEKVGSDAAVYRSNPANFPVDYRAGALSLVLRLANIDHMTSTDLNELRAGFAPQEPDYDVIDIERVAAVAHYVIAKADPGKLGYVKLNKILWYSDLEHYRWRGMSMTGLREYLRTAQGPMSQDISRAVARLVKAKKVAERTVTFAKLTRREMISLAAPDFGALDNEQIGILNQTIQIIAPLSATQLGQITHDDRLWQQVENGEPMPVATGSIVTRPLRVVMAA